MTFLYFRKALRCGKFATFALFLAVFCSSFTALADTNSPASTNISKPLEATTTNRPARPPAVKQAAVASTNAAFGQTSTNDAAYKSALEAHALDDAKKLIGKDGAFKGTLAKLYEPAGLAILEFDTDYKTALTAIVRGTNFSHFPALTNLVGSNLLVTGPFIDFRGKAEMVLEKPEQIKVVR